MNRVQAPLIPPPSPPRRESKSRMEKESNTDNRPTGPPSRHCLVAYGSRSELFSKHSGFNESPFVLLYISPFFFFSFLFFLF